MRYRPKRRWKYTTVDEERYQTGILPDSPIRTDFLFMDMAGLLIIQPRYAWDGASGPTFDTPNTFFASLIHDALYQLMRSEHIDREKWRLRADVILYEILRDKGMMKIRAKLWYKAVRKAAEKSSEYDIITAP